MAGIIAWISTGFTAGDFVTFPTSMGDVTALIIGAPKDVDWTLMGDDGRTVHYTSAPRGIRSAWGTEIVVWRERYRRSA